MNRLGTFGLIQAMTAAVLFFAANVRFAAADEPAFVVPPIQVPPGFAVELAAAPPLVKHPVMACFDDRGRLFLAESAGQNLKRVDLERELPNFVRLLEDTDGDGRFDRSTIFADRMTFPQGALWYRGALYVASPPGIWRLEDTDNDGVADRREMIVGGFNYTGNAADVHGCFLGPEGRIYWCDGRHGHDVVDDQGESVSQRKAACIFSCRPDGGDVRVHCGGGMDNPVEVDFTERGEMLGTVNIMYRVRGDCLVHWMHGGVYPRYDQQHCLEEFPRTGDPLTDALNLGHVAVSGTVRLRGSQLGADLVDNFFITEFNTHKVVRVPLEREGSTFRARKEDFFVSSSGDVHPTDVLEDADGSLLVIDTGGWFRLGCPTSQIAKPEIQGAIYRIRRTGAPRLDDPRGLRIDWPKLSGAALASLLGDERFAVRERAADQLALRGDAALAELEAVVVGGAPAARLSAVWALVRSGSPQASALLRTRMADPDASVRQAAAFGAGCLRDAGATTELAKLVVGGEAPLRREAATALGRIGRAEAVPALLTALADPVDRVLEHALIYALIEIDKREKTLAGLTHDSPRVRRAALIALDQMPHGDLRREQVPPLLASGDLALQTAALEIIARRPGWVNESTALLRDWLAETNLDPARLAIAESLLSTFAANPAAQSLVAEVLARPTISSNVRLALIDVIGRSDVDPLPAAWEQALSAALANLDPAVRRQAVAAIAALDAKAFDAALAKLAQDSSQPADLRVAAWGVLARRGQPLDSAAFSLLTSRLGETLSPADRLAAADVLGNSSLSAEQLSALSGRIAAMGPLELVPLIRAFERGGNQQQGLQLVAALEDSPGLVGLSASSLQKVLSSYPAEVQQAGAALVSKLSVGIEEQTRRLAELEPQMSGGDPLKGKSVFTSKKIACFSCHAISGEGGKVGPDLTGIGQRRNERDLLEAILYPSASFARGFETYNVTTEAGQIFTGLIARETADAIHLRTGQQTEVRIRRTLIEEMIPGRVSIMPQGLERTMTEAELRDLVAYLRSQR